jgi:hypothetical protein
MKLHIGVDSKTGLAHSAVVTEGDGGSQCLRQNQGNRSAHLKVAGRQIRKFQEDPQFSC